MRRRLLLGSEERYWSMTKVVMLLKRAMRSGVSGSTCQCFLCIFFPQLLAHPLLLPYRTSQQQITYQQLVGCHQQGRGGSQRQGSASHFRDWPFLRRSQNRDQQAWVVIQQAFGGSIFFVVETRVAKFIQVSRSVNNGVVLSSRTRTDVNLRCSRGQTRIDYVMSNGRVDDDASL